MSSEKTKPVGRPLKHEDPIEFERLCEEYFTELLEEDGKRWIEPPSIEGLTLHLGFSDCSSLTDYEERPEFSQSVKRARLRIRHFHVTMVGRGDKCVGNIFVLKCNYGYVETSKVQHTGGDGDDKPITLISFVE